MNSFLYSGEVRAIILQTTATLCSTCIQKKDGYFPTSLHYDVRVHIHSPLEGLCSPVWLLLLLLPIAWQSCFAILRPLCLMCFQTKWTHRSLQHTDCGGLHYACSMKLRFLSSSFPPVQIIRHGIIQSRCNKQLGG